MPNYCENDLYVYGEPEKLKEFKEYAKGSGGWIDFNKFIPYPEKFKKQDDKANRWSELKNKKDDELSGDEKKEKILLSMEADERGYITDGYNSGGYEWCLKNWNTKWNACNVELNDNIEEGILTYYFDTAWTPPLPVIKKMSEMFPELKFELRYFECGAGFNGLFKCFGGKVIEDKMGDYFGDRGG